MLDLKAKFRFQRIVEERIPDWADDNRRLPSATSKVAGQWRTSRVEVFRGPLLAFDEPGVRIVTVASAVQMGKSELILNIIGRAIHRDPAPIMVVQPNEAAAEKFTRERLSPMIRECVALRSRIDPRSRMGEDSLYFRQFMGGYVAIEGAGSPMSLASRAIKFVLEDEFDKYPITREGPPSALAEARTATWGESAKIVRVCSPTVTGSSPIWQSYLDGDQRRAAIACPHCHEEFFPRFFEHVEWNKSDDGEHFPMTASPYCPNCGAAISEDQRRGIITTKLGIRWYQTKPFECCGVDQSPLENKHWKWDEENQIGRALCAHCDKPAVSNRHASYQVSQLLSPFTTVATLAADWVTASTNPDDKLVFRNTRLGEPADHEQVIENIEVRELMARRENFSGKLPFEVCGLFAGVDVQTGSDVSDGSLHCYIYGIGLDRQMWSVHTEIIGGDVRQPAVWDKLDKLFLSSWPHECGANMFLAAAAIDAGDGKIAETVVDFCKARRGRNIFAIKGASETTSASWGEIWPPLQAERSRKSGFRVKVIGSNTAKMTVLNRLAVNDPHMPGFIHFGMDWTPERFEQLLAERLIKFRRGGLEYRKFKAIRGRANEGLDATGYALAALQGWLARGYSLERSRQVIDNYSNPKPIPTPSGPRVHHSTWMK